jgi:GDP-L-fucose synthase
MNNSFKGKRILVTGASGFIGTNLIERLVQSEAIVIGTIHKKSPQIDIHGVSYIYADLTNEHDCFKVCEGIDYIFMCAANSSGAGVIEKAPLTHLTPNVVMNSQMLAAAYANNVKKFIFVSSNTVYPLTDFPVKEDETNYDFYNKYHIVGWMKLFSEKMCEMYTHHIKSPMQTLIVRPGNLYGPYDKYNWNDSKVIAALIRRFAEKNNPLDVWGDGNDIKDFLYIDDFIDGLIKATLADINGPINIASGKAATIKDVINALIKIVNLTDLKINYDSSMPSMIPIRLISTELANKKLHWQPQSSLEDGLRKTYEWYLSFYQNVSPELKNDN